MTSKPLQKKVASRIKELRLKRGLLQKDFEKFGYSVRHYQKIENGDLNLTLKTLFKIADALQTDVTSFLRPENESAGAYEEFFFECPLGIIMWQLKDRNDPESLCLFEHNRYGARAVYRDLANSKGKTIVEIFPKAREQGVIQYLYEAIVTGKPRFIPELIRHDENFPLTVFSSQFVRCGPDLGAAIFTDITKEFMARQEANREKRALEKLTRLPVGENAQIRALEDEVDLLLRELGRPAKYSPE